MSEEAVWYDIIRIHPAAELYPLLEGQELIELAADIKRNGLRQKIAILPDFDDDNVMILLDGRNRLNALAVERLPILTSDGRPNPDYFVLADEAAQNNPEAYIASCNLHRRHLNGEQKRTIIAKILAAKPEVSDRRIGGVVGADGKTVGSVRRTMEAGAEIPHLTERVGADGKTQKHNRRDGNRTPRFSRRDGDIPHRQFQTLKRAWDAAGPEARSQFPGLTGVATEHSPQRNLPPPKLTPKGKAKLWANSAKMDEIIHDIHRLAGNGLDIKPNDLAAYLDTERKRINLHGSARQAHKWLGQLLEPVE